MNTAMLFLKQMDSQASDAKFAISNTRTSVGMKQTLPALEGTLTLSNEAISVGRKQTLEVSVFSFHGNIPNVTVNGEIIYPSGLGVILQEVKTDMDGIVSYNWFIDNNTGTGPLA